MSNVYDQEDLDEIDDFDDEFDDDDAYEPLRGEMSGGRKVLLVLLVLFIVFVVVAASAGFWVLRQIDPSGPPGDEVRLSVPSGSSTSTIGQLLEGEGVITNDTIWRFYTRFKDAGPFQAGDYVFQKNSSMGVAIDVLEAGPLPPPFEQFTVPEGLTVPEILAAITADVPTITPDALNQALATGQVVSAFQPAGAAIEGFLFPETYRIEDGQQPIDVLLSMVAQFDAVATELGLADSEARVGLTPYEIVIMASLIQEEARVPEDAPKIARVIYNRIDEGMTLGIDASLCYLKTERPCRLTTADLEDDNPYNTRLNRGLPPTPIAAPGRAALEAALNPVEGPWLYYVLDAAATTPGSHFFTDDFDEFNAKKAECEAAGLGCG